MTKNYLILPLIITLFLPVLGRSQTAPYPASPLIKEMKILWPTHLRLATGSDNWPVTWADDDHQYTVWGDGGGFGGTNRIGRSSIGIARIEGDWHDFSPHNVWGGYKGENAHKVTGKSYGIISVQGILYMWVSLLETKQDPFGEVKLAWSDDHGQSWNFAPWSFYRDDGFMMPTFCNFGKDYEGARDEYIYSYFIRFQSYEGPDNYEDKVHWLNCQKPGLIDLARVKIDQILDQDQYSFFAGLEGKEILWTREVEKRKSVFQNEAGVGWCINVSYNTGLKRYLLTTEHTETHRGNIGVFDAPEPWGPWTTVSYEKQWGKDHIPLNTFYWNFSNKWTSEDGKEFTLIFTGRKENDSFNVVRGEFILQE